MHRRFGPREATAPGKSGDESPQSDNARAALRQVSSGEKASVAGGCGDLVCRRDTICQCSFGYGFSEPVMKRVAACGVGILFLAGVFFIGRMTMFGTATAGELKVGDMAPDFALPGSDGKTYRLSDYHGKQAVVLAWFPKAFTPGCTTECKTMAADGPKIKAFDVAYFTASVDKPEKNKEFAASVGADYPILSDHGGEVAREYGVTGAIQRWASRWTFYIGKDGKILDIDKDVHPSTSVDDIVAKLTALGIPKRN